MGRTPFDGLDELLKPLRDAQSLANEYKGMNHARTLAREAGVYNIRDMLAQHDFGMNARALIELDATAGYAREAAAAAQIQTTAEHAHCLVDNATMHSMAEHLRLPASAITRPDSLTERTLAEMRAIDAGQYAVASARTMESTIEQTQRLIEEAGLVSGAERLGLVHAAGLANLHEMSRASAVDEAMSGATALIGKWMQAPLLTSLMRDAVGVASPLGPSAHEWSQVTDPYDRMQTLALQLEPLGRLIDRYAHVDLLEETVARLQRDWDDARHGLTGVDLDTLQRLEQLDWIDAATAEDEWDDDASIEVDIEDGVDAPAESASEVVPVYVVAARFLSGLALIRARCARLAARFDARAVSAPEALSDWLLIISGHQPAYAARIGILSCRVLHGVWLWNTQLQNIAGTTAVGGEEQLTAADAQEFDEAVVALVAVLEEIEASLNAI